METVMSKKILVMGFIAFSLFIAGCGKKDAPAENKPADTAAAAPKSEDAAVKGETFTNEAAQVSVDLPEGWKYEQTEGGLSAEPAEGGFIVHFQTLQGDELSAALDEADKVLAKEVKDLKLGEVQDLEVNGMPAKVVDGTADGMEVSFGVVNTPVENLCLLVYGFGAPETVKKYQKDITFILQSLKPITK